MAIIETKKQDEVCDLILDIIKRKLANFDANTSYDDLEHAETLSRIYQRIKSVNTN